VGSRIVSTNRDGFVTIHESAELESQLVFHTRVHVD
jgi:hypothetical protein